MMALMDLFKKKQPPAPPPPPGVPPGAPPVAEPAMPVMPSEIPVSDVVRMSEQGLTNNQIIQTLQRQGFNPQQIYDALAQAEAKKSIEPMAPSEPKIDKFESKLEPTTHPDVERLAEQIVEEKWKLLQKDLSKSAEWKDALTSRIDKIEQSVSDLRTDLEGLHKAIVSRIGEYDKTLVDVGTEIKAMEKVFQKVLPELTGNIQELSRVTKKVKEFKK